MQKKYIVITLFIIASIIAGAITYNRYAEKKYIESVRGITNDMMNTYSISKSITEHYAEVWQKGIDNGSDLKQTMMNTMEEAAQQIKSADSILNIINVQISTIHSVPSKYSTLHQNIAELYTLVNQLHQLSKQPQGSFNSFTEAKITNQAAVELLYRKIKKEL